MASKTPQSRPPARPGKPKSAVKPKPGDGLLGWLGRQVGHVKHAVQTDVTKPAPKKPGPQGQVRQSASSMGSPGSTPSTGSPHAGARQTGSQQAGAGRASRPTPTAAQAAAANPDAPSIIVYRQDNIEEAEMPHQPGVKLRRTIIDEVIVVKKRKN
jgi:hypothetical protein